MKSWTFTLYTFVLQNQLDLDAKYVKSLKEGDLSTPNGILDCTAAAYQLQRCVRADIHPGNNYTQKYLHEV